MNRIIISGCNGRMGQVVAACVEERDDCVLVAGFDINGGMSSGFPVFPDPSGCSVQADVVIDFSHPARLDNLLRYGVDTRTPLVIATTGFAAEETEKIKKASRTIPIFFSANMSIGVSLMLELAKKAATVLGSDFDIEIIEKHHNQKIDAPSGTAIMLVGALTEAMEDYHYIYDRHSRRSKRDKKEIGIHSVRGGTIVGDHEVLFAGRDEILSITHKATSKQIFATGAVNAAVFLTRQTPGMYDMGHLVEQS